MAEEKDLLGNLILELRRGTLVLSVLSQVQTPKYGYALTQSLENQGIIIEANTLYPLLRRLEKQGLLISEWDTGESKPRKYYRRTQEGERVYKALRTQWQDMSVRMAQLLEEGENYE
ncbi:MAG: PadR family transcriptional regulator [Clostridia bacterium]|nr:PadR family transcriptional regulator [Lachnospiraceae bacterium]NCC01159.1 PadR family transcriptional regulator [Clostridia bacterium]NCD03057.1 PadR family transcriptional regulator [Clostridia bacterium]